MRFIILCLAILACFASAQRNPEPPKSDKRKPPLGGPTGCHKYTPEVIESIAAVETLAQSALLYLRNRNDMSRLLLLKEFFKSTDVKTFDRVATVFLKIREEARKKGDGLIEFTCRDKHGWCRHKDLDKAKSTLSAYVDPNLDPNAIVLCPKIRKRSKVSMRPRISDFCGGLSKARTFLHEMTHTQIIASTVDKNDGGKYVKVYDDLMKLTAQESIKHAEVYAAFAAAAHHERVKGKGSCTGHGKQYKGYLDDDDSDQNTDDGASDDDYVMPPYE